MAATPVGVCRVLSVPPEPLELPLAADPSVTVTISPPVAHSGPGPVHMRLLCYHLREGQDSPALNALSRSEGVTLGGSLGRWRGTPPLPPSPGLLVHFHGGGFVAQTSRSHEPYLRGWARDLGVPILSVDYALAPESPFPRALEECFYAYCWALRHCHLLGSTAQRVCLAGDSAGGNLCLAVCLRAAAAGLRLPQGVVAAYPVTLVRAAASPSRLLTLLDPLLPLGVLCQCLSAYAGAEEDPDPHPVQPLGPGGLLRRDTGRLLGGLRRGAAAWLGGLLRGTPKEDPKDKELSETPPVTPPGTALPRRSVSQPEGSRQDEEEDEEEEEEAGEGASERIPRWALRYPDEFQPLRTQGPPARFALSAPPLSRNPFMSPLLAPDPMLGSLPPVHLVACALDPMLDDSVALARRLRALGRPVTLRVVPDLPHGFLSLGILSPETKAATAICTRLLRQVLLPHGDTPRRGSQLLGIRRDSLAPHDPQRRGSQLLGARRDSLAPHDPQRRGSQLGAPQDPSRRGSRLLGTRRDSLAPQDPQRRGSQLGAPQSFPRRGSQLLAPQDPSRRASVLWESPRQNLVPHGLGSSPNPGPTAAAPHGAGGTGAASPGGGGAGTQGSGTATAPGPGTDLTPGTSAALPHGTGTDLTPGTSAALPHGTGATSTLCDGTSPTYATVATSAPGTATANSDGTTVTHGTSTALPRGTGATSSPGVAMPDGNATTVTRGPGAALPPGSAAAPGDAPTPPHGAGSLAPPRRPSSLCCGAQAEAEGPSPPDTPSPPRAPPGRRLSGAQAVARRPSGPAGREVGS